MTLNLCATLSPYAESNATDRLKITAGNALHLEIIREERDICHQGIERSPTPAHRKRLDFISPITRFQAANRDDLAQNVGDIGDRS